MQLEGLADSDSSIPKDGLYSNGEISMFDDLSISVIRCPLQNKALVLIISVVQPGPDPCALTHMGPDPAKYLCLCLTLNM